MAKIKRALISVSDKTGIVEFSRELARYQVEILSTGGTAKILRDAGLVVKDVSEFTGFPEMLDGRVKTLHPKVHGGLLGMRSNPDHVAKMKEYGIEPIDMVVVNLYPFESTVEKAGCTLEEAIENIDIGGPTMLRSAAKNHPDVTVIVNHEDYGKVLLEMAQSEGSVSAKTNFQLAVKVFQHTAGYDGAISNYLGKQLGPEYAQFPPVFTLQVFKHPTIELRYGENPHQPAGYYLDKQVPPGTIAAAVQFTGKELSFNNILDAEAALECVKQFRDYPACVIVKHQTPCGVAEHSNIAGAYNLAYNTDPTSAFGGVIAFNRELDHLTANNIITRQFVEVIIAPAVTAEAMEIISAKKNIRLLICGEWPEYPSPQFNLRRINGGLLFQETDYGLIKDIKNVTVAEPSEQNWHDMISAMKVAKFVKSNAIVFVKNRVTLAIGAGQMNRVKSARIAPMNMDGPDIDLTGSIMASDAFFPFRDSIDAAAKAGVVAIIQPGGSIRDQEVIKAANEHGIVMIFTGMRHFRH